MAKNNRIRSQEPPLPVPTSMADVDAYVAEIQRRRRIVEAEEARIEEEIRRLKAKGVALVSQETAEIERLFRGIVAYAQAHRSEITNHGRRKSVKLPAGQIGWRNSKRTEVDNEEAAIRAALQLGLSELLRVKHELKRKELAADPNGASQLPGVRIVEGEVFFVKPNEVDLTLTAEVKNLTS